jgi:transposase
VCRKSGTHGFEAEVEGAVPPSIVTNSGPFMESTSKHSIYPPEIAPIVFRSRDTVERVLKRFLHGGVAAIPRRKAPGMVPTVTPEWQAELLRVIDLDPQTVGIHSANWTTGLLATYLAGKTQIAVTDETVRLYLRAAGYVCKRPT